MRKSLFVTLLAIVLFLIVACAEPPATPPAATAVAQTTPTHTAVPTATPSSTPTFTPSATHTATPTPTDTATPTFTPTATNTPTATPTATAVGGGGQIILQMPRNLYDPEADAATIDLFAVKSDGTNLRPLTDGFNRFVTYAIPSPDNRYLLITSYGSWPHSQFAERQLAVVGADGSWRTVGIVTRYFWLADGRFVYLSNVGGGSVGAFISSSTGDETRRLSPPEHNIVLIYPVSSDLERIYYETGSRSGGNITTTGFYWAAIDDPIIGLVWDRLAQNYYHHPYWELEFNGQTYPISTIYNIGRMFPNGLVEVRVDHHGLPEELIPEELFDDDTWRWENSMYLPPDALSSLATPPASMPESSVIPNFCSDTFSPDGSIMVIATYSEGEESRCPGGRLYIYSFAEEIYSPLPEGYPHFRGFSPDGQLLILLDPEWNPALYNLATGIFTPLAVIGSDYNAYLFSPDGRTMLAAHNPTFEETTTTILPVLIDLESQTSRPLLPQLEETNAHIRVIAWLP